MLNKLKKNKYTRYWPQVLLILFLVGGFAVRLYKINNPVADWHSWRQADTASVTRLYLQNGLDLLHPRYHDISRIQTGYFNPDGYRFVELPIFNVIHIVFHNLFSNVSLEVAGRLVSIVAALVTSFYLYKLTREYLGEIGGLTSAFLYLFLPYNIYFTRVILPDPLAVCFAVVGVYYFYLYTKSEKYWPLAISAVATSLGMLTKPHAIFISLPIIFMAYDKFGLKGMLKNKALYIALNVIVVPFLLWRIWMYQAGFVRGIAHFTWAFNGDGIRFKPAFWQWLFGERIGRLILGMWGTALVVLGVANFSKKYMTTYLLLVGAFLYMSIFATANVRHDYYQIFIIPAIVIAAAQGVVFLVNSKSLKKYVVLPILGFTVFMTLGMGWYAIRDDYQINNPAIISAGEALDRLAPKDALVIAPYNGDAAFLYQTNRFGWPMVTEDINDLIAQGADYYVSVDMNSTDTLNFKNRFETVKEESNYIILDLHEEKSQ